MLPCRATCVFIVASQFARQRFVLHFLVPTGPRYDVPLARPLLSSQRRGNVNQVRFEE